MDLNLFFLNLFINYIPKPDTRAMSFFTNKNILRKEFLRILALI